MFFTSLMSMRITLRRSFCPAFMAVFMSSWSRVSRSIGRFLWGFLGVRGCREAVLPGDNGASGPYPTAGGDAPHLQGVAAPTGRTGPAGGRIQIGRPYPPLFGVYGRT